MKEEENRQSNEKTHTVHYDWQGALADRTTSQQTDGQTYKQTRDTHNDDPTTQPLKCHLQSVEIVRVFLVRGAAPRLAAAVTHARRQVLAASPTPPTTYLPLNMHTFHWQVQAASPLRSCRLVGVLRVVSTLCVWCWCSACGGIPFAPWSSACGP